MNQESWPTPPASSPEPLPPAREPLPRVEDLPVAEQGYEQESVKAAFDSFYRHAAQLDAALRTLEAVDSFHRHANALRSDLRALRSAGWTQQPWAATPTYGYSRREREGVSPAVWRIGGEAALLIAVAVALGVARLSWWLIVLVMGLAWALVGAIEWLAARERLLMPRAGIPAPLPVLEGEAAVAEQPDDAEPLGWTAFEESQEPSDAMTIIGAPPAEDRAEAVAEPEPEPLPTPDPVPAPDPEPDREPELPPAAVAESDEQDGARRRWWRRGGPDGEDVELEVEQPRHVRVLDPLDEAPPPALDPWEHGFDFPEAGQEDSEEDAGSEDESFGNDAGETEQRRVRRR